MGFLYSTISVNPQISPAIPFLSWRSRKNPSKLLTIHSSRNLHLQPSFSLCLCRSLQSKRFRISAHLQRPTKRQNYLRKKLTQQRERQQQVSHLQIPADELNKVGIYESGFDDSAELIEKMGKSSSLDDESNFDSSYEHSTSGNLDNNNELEAELGKMERGESVMRNKLENWAELYKKDSEFWGIGTGPIFTIFQDSEGKVERVVVNEDEIMRRSLIDPRLDNENEDSVKVNLKISLAKDLARQMENGNNVIDKNSTVAKFLSSCGESGIMKAIQAVSLQRVSLSRVSRGGILVVCGLFVVWSVRGLLIAWNDNKEHSGLEKEMLRRKMKARSEIEKIVIDNVEVMHGSVEPKSVPFKRPQLNREELVNSIIKAKGPNGEVAIVKIPGYENKEFNDKIEEIKAMARHAREVEKRESLVDDGGEEDNELGSKEVSEESESAENEIDVIQDVDETIKSTSFMGEKDDIGQSSDEIAMPKSEMEFSVVHNVITPNGTENLRYELSKNVHSDDPGWQLGLRENSSRKKLRIIKSAKEAREYLSTKHHKPEVNLEDELRNDEQIDFASTNVPSPLGGLQDSSHTSETHSMDGETEENLDILNGIEHSRISSGHEVSVSNRDTEAPIDKIPQKEETVKDEDETDSTFAEVDLNNSVQKEELSAPVKKHNSEELGVRKENWMKKNFHEIEPIMKKIGEGFRDSYNLAREKANEEFVELKSYDAEEELEWMKDEKLRDIVFKVRDNELSGRDPFHLMKEEEKRMFFTGLEKKVEQVNERMLNLHEYFHSNIENLDYGRDGFSIFDPPEKIIPRWKTPPPETNPEFLNKVEEQRKTLIAEGLKSSSLSRKTEKNDIEKPKEPSSNQMDPIKLQKDTLRSSKTVIEGSDGSVKAGKKSGKEFWQHTKKWSQGFLECYNAEKDPEVKAVMREMGKDLDRWMTEEEIKEAADRINRIPEKQRKFFKEKLDKVKREMEMFGQEAVLSKYREYADEKEVDHLWWLDLPYVLCIELYKMENGKREVGFYSLEMAADLELDPKQHHVIAFEDAGDCKNLCYIINTHMEMMGNGTAFVVAQPPKDAFRDAKANGFSVTVIRKGQLQLNIDQTLEEVEESIEEIGSKIYYDKIMKERSVDINGLMKGVFGVNTNKSGRKKKMKRKPKRRIRPGN